MEKIHDRLRAELEAHGLSAAQAARDAGQLDSQGLRDVLSGRKRLTADMLGALVDGAGVDAHYVLTGRRVGGLTAEEQVLLEYFREAPKEGRRAALGVLMGIAAPSHGNTATVTNSFLSRASNKIKS